MTPDWSGYYKATKSRPPRALLIKALKYVTHKEKAIDIGGGVLNDTRYLLAQGFEVTVIDKSQEVEEEAKTIQNNKLTALTTAFEDFSFPKNEYDLASAMYALPFTPPQYFNAVFKRIRDSLKKEGVFCGQFFGERDGWNDKPDMTFHTEAQVHELLKGLEVISFKEEEKDDRTAKGDMKHWHVFHVIARK